MKELKKIVWIASYPKSGNTWFRSFLVCLLHSKNNSLDINDLSSIPVASSRSLFDKFSGVASSELLQAEIEELRSSVYQKIAENTTGLQFIKVHDYWHKTPSGKAMFDPDISKGVIYLIRNPMDIAISFSNHLGIGIEETIDKMNNAKSELCYREEKLYHQFRQKLATWSEHVNSWKEQSGIPVKVLKYESMLENADACFRSALDFLNIEFQEDHFKKALNECNFINMARQESEFGFSEKPIKMNRFFNVGTAGSGKKILTNDQIQRLRAHHFQTMAEYDYIK